FVFLMRCSRMAASASDTDMSDPYPVSTFFVSSIIPLMVSGSIPVKWPASPSIDFSIKALHGQTVTHWPQDTHDDSLIETPSSHMTRGCSRDQSIERVSFTCTS